MQKTLDLSIKKNEIGTTDGGYSVNGGKSYSSYMDNKQWDEFKKNMKENAYKEYTAGSGGELKQKGQFPPKMASYGSSSRMIYNLCKSVTDFHFEYQLPTQVGGTAHLDGFLEKENEFIFVEAKCREPYGKKPSLIETKYKELYQYINNAENCNLCISTENVGSKMEVVFSIGETIISKFDIKQMICHLLGIAVKFLNVPTKKDIHFLYLCYNPKLIEIIDKKKTGTIYATYEQMCDECSSIDFCTLFTVILKYLSKKLHVGNATEEEINAMATNFSFELCNQENYMKFIN